MGFKSCMQSGGLWVCVDLFQEGDGERTGLVNVPPSTRSQSARCSMIDRMAGSVGKCDGSFWNVRCEVVGKLGHSACANIQDQGV